MCLKVKNVYYMTNSGELFERQASSDTSKTWENDNFSGLYSAANTSRLATTWLQDTRNMNQTLTILREGTGSARGITAGTYTSDFETSNEWISDDMGVSISVGSTFALAPSGTWYDILYTVNTNGKLLQQQYYMETQTVSSKSSGICSYYTSSKQIRF